MENIFEEAGLNRNESKVYETLVKYGKMGSAKISDYSGVPYGRIYNVLGDLIEKGLVQIIPEKTKKFVTTSPQKLIDMLNKKQKDIESAKEKAKELKKFYESGDVEVVKVGYGDRGFWKIAEEMSEIKQYEYNIRWSFKERRGNLSKIRKDIRKGRDHKNLVRFDDETSKDIIEASKFDTNIRKIENHGVALSIIDDKEVMIGLVKSNTTMLIRDAAFAKIMKRMFLETYKNAEEIK